MERRHFSVLGDDGAQYELTAERIGERLTMSCTCKYATFGRKCCKHQRALLDGQTDRLLSYNASEVALLREMMHGTKSEELMARYREADKAYAEVEKHFEKAKRARKAAEAALSREVWEPI